MCICLSILIEDLRETLCRLLEVLLCVFVSSPLLSSVTSSQPTLPGLLASLSQLKEATRFDLGFPVLTSYLVSHLSGVTVLLCLMSYILKNSCLMYCVQCFCYFRLESIVKLCYSMLTRRIDQYDIFFSVLSLPIRFAFM